MRKITANRGFLEGRAIEPRVSVLYRKYLALELSDRARDAWLRLRQYGLTQARTPLGTLDSVTRAIGLFEWVRSRYTGQVGIAGPNPI